MVGKALINHFYGRPQDKSYYLGCSTGGRQAFQNIGMYPDDFDGVLAGAPAVDWHHLMGSTMLLGQYTGAPYGPSSSNYIPPEKWRLISEEINKQCDALDGVLDGIITEPDDCNFHPETLACPAGTADSCLTQPQVEALNRVYKPLFDFEGKLLYPRVDPGAESNRGYEWALLGQYPLIPVVRAISIT